MIKFKDSIGDITSAQLKKLLAPVLDFEKHSAAENYLDTLPPETQQAIKEKKAIQGMDSEAVILALGKPLRKTRETKDDVEQETWQFGEPPGRVIFVTFASSKVIACATPMRRWAEAWPRSPAPITETRLQNSGTRHTLLR